MKTEMHLKCLGKNFPELIISLVVKKISSKWESFFLNDHISVL